MYTCKVAAIIVTYNPELSSFSNLVCSLENQVDLILIIDNNSSNKQFLDVFKNKLNIIFLDKNVGLAAAQNIGINSLKQNITHVILFDQDSYISEFFVKYMLEFELNLLNNGYHVSAIGPKLVDEETGYEYPATIYKGIFKKRPKVTEKIVEQTYIIASGSLIRTEVLKKVGLMREEFFIDFIDVEWCFRAKSFGYNCYINPKLSMRHSMGDSRVSLFGKKISMHSDNRRYFTFRNALLLSKLNYVDSSYLRIVIFYNFIRFFLGIFASDNKIKTFKIYIKGWIDGFKG